MYLDRRIPKLSSVFQSNMCELTVFVLRNCQLLIATKHYTRFLEPHKSTFRQNKLTIMFHFSETYVNLNCGQKSEA
jgi:hypothetical protein